MSDREQRILSYWADRMNQEYVHEAKYLKAAKDFLEMFEQCEVIREAAATTNGVSDLVFCYKGRFIAAELKRIGGTPSPQQLKFIDKVRKAGGAAAVCRNLKDIHRLMQSTTIFP